MDYLGKEFKNRINQSLEHLPYPNAEELLNSAYLCASTSKNKRGVKITALLVSIIAFILLAGFATIIYFFPNDNSENLNFSTIQNQGYINVYNKAVNQEGIGLTVKAMFSDQQKTYIRIEVTGKLPEEIEIKERKDKGRYDSLGLNVIQHIEDVQLVDSTGKNISWKNQVEYQSDEITIAQDNPILKSNQLASNEAILVFLNSPTKDAEFSLSFKFYGIDVPFIIEGLSLKMPDIVEREIDNVEFSIDIGKGIIKKITYTPLETIFTIDWTITDQEALPDFYVKYDTYYKNGKKEGFFNSPYPQISNDDGKTYENEFVLNEVLDPDEDLNIDLYEYIQLTGEEKFIRNFVFIPKR